MSVLARSQKLRNFIDHFVQLIYTVLSSRVKDAIRHIRAHLKPRSLPGLTPQSSLYHIHAHPILCLTCIHSRSKRDSQIFFRQSIRSSTSGFLPQKNNRSPAPNILLRKKVAFMSFGNETTRTDVQRCQERIIVFIMATYYLFILKQTHPPALILQACLRGAFIPRINGTERKASDLGRTYFQDTSFLFLSLKQHPINQFSGSRYIIKSWSVLQINNSQPEEAKSDSEDHGYILLPPGYRSPGHLLPSDESDRIEEAYCNGRRIWATIHHCPILRILYALADYRETSQ